MKKIIKYKANNGIEFLSKKDCKLYEDLLVDNNNKKYKIGDLIKESWYFHGFGYPIGDVTKINDIEFKNNHKSFRFIKYDGKIIFDINRINCQGWPVSGYEIEIISNKDKEKLENDNQYIFDDYYRCYIRNSRII